MIVTPLPRGKTLNRILGIYQHRNFSVWVVLGIFIMSYPSYGQVEKLKKEIEKILIHDTDISYDLTPGFVIGILDGDQQYILSLGKNAIARKDTLKTNALFELGSLTKSFTAALIHILEEEGKLDKHDPVNKYLLTKWQNPRLDTVKIEDLLQFRFALPTRPQGFGEKELNPSNPYANYLKDDLLTFYSQYVPDKSMDHFSNSHSNYALLEIIIESATGQEFAEVLRTRLTEPLQMKSAFINYGEARKNIITEGVERNGSPATPWEFSSFAGSEGLKSNAQDLIRFMEAFLNPNSLFYSTFSEMLSVESSAFNDKLTFNGGWYKVEVSKRIYAFLNAGHTGGHSSFAAFVPQTRTGVVVLSNSSVGTRDLGILILRMVNDNWKRKSY